MDIAVFISDLLNQKEEVILPGLGSFFKQKMSGYYDSKQHKLYPPSLQLSFKETSNNEDETLASFISNQKNISLDSARYFLEKLIVEIKEVLNLQKSYDLGNLGTLELKQQEIQFTANQDFKLDTKTFGLPPVALLRNQETSILENYISETPVTEEAVVQVQEDEEVYEEEAEKSGNSFIKWLIAFVIVLALVAMSVTIYFFRPAFLKAYNYSFPWQEPENSSQLPVPYINTDSLAEEKKKADSIYNSNLLQQFPDAEKAKDSLNVTVTKTVIPPKGSARYELIIASWQTKTKAESHVKALKKGGYDAHIVSDAPGPRIKVSIGTFTNRNDGLQALDKANKNFKNNADLIAIKNK